MKVLIAYDGSRASEAAIDDLVLVGLPHQGTAHILSVAEVSVPQPRTLQGRNQACTPAVAEMVTTFKRYGERSITEAEILAKHAEGRVKKILPDWNVFSVSTYGSPAREILDIAENLSPD